MPNTDYPGPKPDIGNLLTPGEVAEILNLHVLTVYDYIRRGYLDAIRLGRSYRIVPHDLEAFIESMRVSKSTAAVSRAALREK